MLERGLVERKAGSVWWCPVDQTVLANEQVLEGNVCERCGSPVYKRDLKQWYFKITRYADELLAGLDTIDWPERVKTMQRNWIGRSEGALLTFSTERGDPLDVFTTRPDTVWGATFMVLAPEHPLVAEITTSDQRAEVDAYVEMTRTETDIDRLSTDAARPRTGVFTGAYAINPVNDEHIPIWIADYVLMTYGTGAIMAVPYGDQRDFEFARAFGLPIRAIVQPADGSPVDPAERSEAYHGSGVLINSGPFDGRETPEVIPDVIAWLASEGRGKAEVTYRLRDWLISRQRYWGTPIPIVYCDVHGEVPIPESELPVLLPLDAEFKPTGQSPLVTHEEFLTRHVRSAANRVAGRRIPWIRSWTRPGTGFGIWTLTIRMRRLSRSASRVVTGRSLHRRHRARHLAPALRAFLHKSAARPRLRRTRRALHALAQPGDHPFRRGGENEQEPGHASRS